MCREAMSYALCRGTESPDTGRCVFGVRLPGDGSAVEPGRGPASGLCLTGRLLPSTSCLCHVKELVLTESSRRLLFAPLPSYSRAQVALQLIVSCL